MNLHINKKQIVNKIRLYKIIPWFPFVKSKKHLLQLRKSIVMRIYIFQYIKDNQSIIDNDTLSTICSFL